MTRAHLHALLVPALVFTASCLDRQYQSDFWLHLARGHAIVANGELLRRKPFITFTSEPREVRDASWLSQVVFDRLFGWGGLQLVQVVNAGVLALAFGMLYRTCRRGGVGGGIGGSGRTGFQPVEGVVPHAGSVVPDRHEHGAQRLFALRRKNAALGLTSVEYPRSGVGYHACTGWKPVPGQSWEHGTNVSSGAACAACVVAFLGVWQTFLIRPQSISFLLFVLLYAVAARRGRAALLALPPLILAAWVNLHGGFLIGLVLLGAFALAAAWEWWRGVSGNEILVRSASLVLAGLATLINPYGWRIYGYATLLARRAVERHVDEWLPPWPDRWIGVAFAASLVLVPLLFVLARRRPRAREAVLMLCFLPLACRSTRMVPWWFLVIAPVVAELIGTVRRADPAGVPEDREKLARWVPAGLCAVLLASCVLSLPWLERWNPLFGTVRSAHRTEDDLARLCARVLPDKGRVFARLEWAEYLDWALGPNHRVFLDGYVEQYDDDVWQGYCRVTAGEAGWDGFLVKSRVDYLLLDATYHTSLLRQVARSRDWEERGRAGDAVVYARRDAADVRPRRAPGAADPIADTRD